ncbi:RND efflux system, outer membrane lipoprotein, NodT family [Gluconacetobacter diazotrophicus PA1 5]|uniref:Outer membrane protein n=1 Tax=Gluconacetobacter diazotrophicus (strain ATCC 49037 / DSM 5601 / CCUG 37298 / CIP 103539 / LMG 7603 / PAl5) TaxID=272568 RepID=A9H3F7_GLUDA|nr:efflux transporter outer membrane subunit [Gluconacetobacter diazotrophicus]ACI52732.1 RND efflux system, outer membrane lipoprotein, NodT family [Gluconacetobacter diazotrophicus PA1 5]TWB06144.1 NodT family efflux transporter outer membrane factor (OMF) lipoprotein [Gluconacetobacter diazotrophicus]CAP57311.1 Outer membrane protein [Gluconacetobacter diazotrophicus PA1 5]
MTSPFSLMSRRGALHLGGILAPLALAGCMVGPSYHRPAAPVSARFKELTPAAGWERARPAMAELPKGAWWTIYNDPVLNRLESQVAISNQNVRMYEANYRQARAMIDSVRAQLFPTLSGSLGFNRNSQGRGSRSASTGSLVSYGGAATNTTETTYSMGPSASWDLDLWGRIRRNIQSQVTEAQASAADLANATLSYQAQLATAYFNLRYQDSLQELLRRYVDFNTQALQITQNQYEAGTADPTAVMQARTQLEQNRATLIQAGIARAQYEHAIAVLMGRPPADLTITPGTLPRQIPAIPVGVPADLLQRRPDVAAAERAMEQYNAQIGADMAAFFPDVTLTADYSYSGDPIGQLVQVVNRIWSLGASASEVLFQGGSRMAAVHGANAQYDSAVATYRQTVLTALQNTEDNLSNLRILEQQATQQQIALDFANQAVQVSLNQYEAGTQIYTTVITNETTALSNAESALSIQQQRMVDSVALVQALGGGWNATSLPSKASMQTDNPFLPSFIQKDKNQ